MDNSLSYKYFTKLPEKDSLIGRGKLLNPNLPEVPLREGAYYGYRRVFADK